jgi:hypothetical protein
MEIPKMKKTLLALALVMPSFAMASQTPQVSCSAPPCLWAGNGSNLTISPGTHSDVRMTWSGMNWTVDRVEINADSSLTLHGMKGEDDLNIARANISRAGDGMERVELHEVTLDRRNNGMLIIRRFTAFHSVSEMEWRDIIIQNVSAYTSARIPSMVGPSFGPAMALSVGELNIDRFRLDSVQVFGGMRTLLATRLETAGGYGMFPGGGAERLTLAIYDDRPNPGFRLSVQGVRRLNRPNDPPSGFIMEADRTDTGAIANLGSTPNSVGLRWNLNFRWDGNSPRGPGINVLDWLGADLKLSEIVLRLEDRDNTLMSLRNGGAGQLARDVLNSVQASPMFLMGLGFDRNAAERLRSWILDPRGEIFLRGSRQNNGRLNWTVRP